MYMYLQDDSRTTNYSLCGFHMQDSGQIPLIQKQEQLHVSMKDLYARVIPIRILKKVKSRRHLVKMFENGLTFELFLSAKLEDCRLFAYESKFFFEQADRFIMGTGFTEFTD